MSILKFQDWITLNEFTSYEIGDRNFPLDVNPETDVLHKHEHIGQTAEVTPYAVEQLRDLHGEKGTVKAVFMKYGQLAGYEVEINDKTYYGTKKDFFIDNGYVEDVYLDSPKAMVVQHALRHFREQRNYFGTSWDGIELLCFNLARSVDYCALESAGWYKYPSSRNEDKDGKDWRMVVKDVSDTIAVNLHSMLHEGVWTLATTIYSTANIDPDKLEFIGDDNSQWLRTLMWVKKTAEILSTDGFKYTDTISLYNKRIQQTKKVQSIVDANKDNVFDVYERIKGEKVKVPNRRVDFGVSRLFVPPGAIGVQVNPTDERPYSSVSIHPDAVESDKPGYLEAVVKHELIHCAVGDDCKHDHGPTFNKVAEEIGLKDVYRD